jgi:hypothetical protein
MMDVRHSCPPSCRISQQDTATWATIMSNNGCASEFYEYLDHTADVQLHAWGKTLGDAFINVIKCMFNFITDMNTVSVNKEKSIEFTVNGEIITIDFYSYILKVI